MGKVIMDYRELDVYQRAFESAMRIFEVTRSFPREERYSLSDQIRRSSRAVCSNIAEAWRKRRYPAHFVSKLSDSDAEAAETLTWLDFALECQYIGQDIHTELFDHYDHICAQLTKMMNNPDQWCHSAK
jgi:four helix bundle protein